MHCPTKKNDSFDEREAGSSFSVCVIALFVKLVTAFFYSNLYVRN